MLTARDMQVIEEAAAQAAAGPTVRSELVAELVRVARELDRCNRGLAKAFAACDVPLPHQAGGVPVEARQA
jgi:hypothetical protein